MLRKVTYEELPARVSDWIDGELWAAYCQQAVLDLPAESHVGRECVALLRAAEGVLLRYGMEQDLRARIGATVAEQCNVWLFG